MPTATPKSASPPERPASSAPADAPPPEPEEGRAPAAPGRRVRVALLAVALVVGAAAVAAGVGVDRPTDEELNQQAAAHQTAWRNYLQYAPRPLEGGFATGALAVGDGVSPEGRIEDYYAFEAPDSSAFSVIVTAAGFAPDLVVTTPSGRRVAASTLWQTEHRAEVPGLRGPGRYVIAVTARAPGVGGAYELSAGSPPMPRLLESGDAVDSTLGRSGPVRAGRYEDHYAIVVPPGESVLVAVRSRAFRPRLALLGPEGQVVAPWGSVSHIDTDTLHTAAFRYQPGWDSPYLLLVSSDGEGQRGDYAVEVERVRILAVPTDGAAVKGTLGESGWYRDGHYGDTYAFEAAEGTSAVLEVRSEAFKPVLVLRQGEREVARSSGGGAVRMEQELEGGRYEVDVTSEDADATGDYTLAVTVDTPDGPRTQTFSAEARRVGTTVRQHTFEVTVRRVRVTPAGDDRVQVRLDVEERSLDFMGEWDEWARRVGRTRLVDNTGRVYLPVDASGGQDDDAVMPGGTRRGRIVFEAPRAGGRPTQILLRYPIGVDGRVVVEIPVELQR